MVKKKEALISLPGSWPAVHCMQYCERVLGNKSVMSQDLTMPATK